MLNHIVNFVTGLGLFVGALLAIFVAVKIVAVAIFQAKKEVDENRLNRHGNFPRNRK
jgi:hypothetical protein